MSLAEARDVWLKLVLADATAVYPLVIDPLLTATADAHLEQNQVNAELGYSVAGAGDVNGDGYSDVLVGANLFDNGQTNEGAAFVYHGGASGVDPIAEPPWRATKPTPAWAIAWRERGM